MKEFLNEVIGVNLDKAALITDNIYHTGLLVDFAILLVGAIIKFKGGASAGNVITVMTVFILMLGFVSFQDAALKVSTSLANGIAGQEEQTELLEFFTKANESKFSEDEGKKSIWKTIRSVSGEGVITAIYQFIFSICDLLIRFIYNCAEFVQNLILGILPILAPLGISFLLIPFLHDKGVKFLLFSLELSLWQVGWAIGMLFTKAIVLIVGFQIDALGINLPQITFTACLIVVWTLLYVLATPFILNSFISRGPGSNKLINFSREAFQSVAAVKTLGGSKVAQGATKLATNKAKSGGDSKNLSLSNVTGQSARQGGIIVFR